MPSIFLSVYEKKQASRRVLNRHTDIVLNPSEPVHQSNSALHDETVRTDDEMKQQLLKKQEIMERKRDSLWKKYMEQENEKHLEELQQIMNGTQFYFLSERQHGQNHVPAGAVVKFTQEK